MIFRFRTQIIVCVQPLFGPTALFVCSHFVVCVKPFVCTMVVPRLTAPKEIGTSDLEGVLEKFMAARGSRDLWTLLASLRLGVSWKNAPRAQVLAEFVEFFKLFVALSPQGVIPSKKLALAFEATHRTRPTNFSGKDLAVFGDDLSSLVRCGMAKYRALVTDGESHRRCFAKVRVVCLVYDCVANL